MACFLHSSRFFFSRPFYRSPGTTKILPPCQIEPTSQIKPSSQKKSSPLWKKKLINRDIPKKVILPKKKLYYQKKISSGQTKINHLPKKLLKKTSQICRFKNQCGLKKIKTLVDVLTTIPIPYLPIKKQFPQQIDQ